SGRVRQPRAPVRAGGRPPEPGEVTLLVTARIGSGGREGQKAKRGPRGPRRMRTLPKGIAYCCWPCGYRTDWPLTKQISSLNRFVVPVAQLLPVPSFPCE